MSALFGVWRKDGAPSAAASLEAMEGAMSDWACDRRAVHHDVRVGLGHRVRADTPQSAHETLPRADPDVPGLVITADAWLDNRVELCDALRLPRSLRTATPDSALIAGAYLKWGDACASKLRGDFAFALWDGRIEAWYCARDYLGFKPFVYFDSPRLFCFASDVRGVLACPGVPGRLNQALLAAYLVQHTGSAEKRLTFFEDVVKLPPAHFLVVGHGATRLTRYWSPQDVPVASPSSLHTAAERCCGLLEQAVQRSTRTTLRVGAHLSGGLDSTSVAVLASRRVRESGQILHGYSWSPPVTAPIDDPNDERRFIETVCAREGIEARYLTYRPDDVVAVFTRDVTRIPREMAVREEQLQDQAAHEGVGLLLSGWGGDELVSYSGGGYLAELTRRGAWSEVHRAIVERLPRGMPALRRWRAYGGIIYRQIVWTLAPDAVWELRTRRNPAHHYRTYAHPDFLREQRHAVRALRDPPARDRPGVRATQIFRLEHGHLTRRVESWATHGAKRGIVYRHPLLDRDVVEFCLGLSPSVYSAEGRSRALLRCAAQGILPEPMRTTRTKTESASFGVLGDVLLGAAHALYERTRPLFARHPAAQCVNVGAVDSAMQSGALEGTRALPLLYALSCFYIGRVADAGTHGSRRHT